jgi:alcohol dehydrogenase YqhD (iron-dependent ADH family)
MFDFTFHNPTQIRFGRDREQELGTLLKEAGIQRVLLVYGGGSVVRTGLLDRIRHSLKDADVAFEEHGGVRSNPVLTHAEAGVEKVRNFDAQALVPIGGGSVYDEAKAIAVGALSDAPLWAFYTGRNIEAALPVYGVLTLAASGSEMNGNSVLTREETKQKYSFSSLHTYPKVSILNPALTATVPADYTAYGAVDAIAHVLEGYFTKAPGTTLQDEMVEMIIRSVMRATGRVMADLSDYEGRAELMWAATLALNGLTPAGTGPFAFPNHAIEHAISGLYPDIAHGAGLAVVMPAWMRWHSHKNPDQYARFGREIFGVESAQAGIEALEAWFRTIGAPTRLSEIGIEKSAIAPLAKHAAALCTDWGLKEYDEATLSALFESMV